MNGQQAGLLTQNMSPEQARLLDQQLRQKQFQGKNFGGGALGNFLTSASGAIQGAAGAGQGVAERFGAQRNVGANEQQAMKSQGQLQEMTDAIRTAEGATQSARLLNAAEKLEKSGNPQAVLKAMQLREQAASLGVEEQKLELQKKQVGYQADRISIDKTEAENRRIQLQQQQEQQKASNDLEQRRINASITEQKVVIDSEGNRFNMITTEGGDVKYVGLGEVEQPVGRTQTINELTVDKQIQARNDLQFNKEFLDSRKEAVTAFNNTKKVFTSADTAYKLLQELTGAGGTTGGILAETERKIKRYLGIADEKSVPAELLKKELGMAIATNLKATFGGSQITDSERKFLEANMISIEDTLPVIMRKLEATMEVSKSGLEKLTALSGAKGYTEFVGLQNKYIEQDYLDVQDKYELTFGQESRANSLDQLTPEQIRARQLIEQRQAEKVRQSRRGSGARIGTSL